MGATRQNHSSAQRIPVPSFHAEKKARGFVGRKRGARGVQRRRYFADESVASHVATALENAIAFDKAESYQKQLVQERDRSRLLLEINNHLISHLNVDDLLRAASASIRKHFANNFAGFWIIDKERNRLDCAALDLRARDFWPIFPWRN